LGLWLNASATQDATVHLAAVPALAAWAPDARLQFRWNATDNATLPPIYESDAFEVTPELHTGYAVLGATDALSATRTYSVSVSDGLGGLGVASAALDIDARVELGAPVWVVVQWPSTRATWNATLVLSCPLAITGLRVVSVQGPGAATGVVVQFEAVPPGPALSHPVTFHASGLVPSLEGVWLNVTIGVDVAGLRASFTVIAPPAHARLNMPPTVDLRVRNATTSEVGVGMVANASLSTDVNGDTNLTYTWRRVVAATGLAHACELVGNVGWVPLPLPSGGVTPSVAVFNGAAPCSYTFEVMVTDSHGLSSSRQVGG